MRCLAFLFVFAACDAQPAPVTPSASASVTASVVVPPPVLDPAVREEVTVGDERWRLVWREPPKPICHDWNWGGPQCACFNYDFAEAGKADLVRMKGGVAIDKLDVSKLVGEPSDYTLWLPRWRRAKDDVREKVPLDEAKRGEIITLMRPLDYDHDGHATEFALRVNRGGGPCGHYDEVIVLGISTKAPKLHAFSDVHGQMIELRGYDDWTKLSRAKSGEKIRVEDLTCGDHGSEEHQWRDVFWDAEGIHVQEKTGKCD